MKVKITFANKFTSINETYFFCSWVIRLGDIDNDEVVERKMGNIYIHPDYKSDQAYFDLALVKVFHADYSDTIIPLCLPVRTDLAGNRYVGKSVTVAGWGSFNLSNVASDVLKSAPLTVLPARQGLNFNDYNNVTAIRLF